MIFLFVKDRGGDPLDANAIGALPSIDLPDFAIDAEVNESRQTTAQWTEFPIEEGATVSDFMWVKPEPYSFEGPITTLNPLGAPRGKQGVTALSEKMVSILKEGVAVTVVFGFWTKDLFLEDIQQSRNQQTGEALNFVVKLREVLQATTETVTIPASRLRRKVRRKGAGKGNGVGFPPGPSDKAFALDAFEAGGAGILNNAGIRPGFTD